MPAARDFLILGRLPWALTGLEAEVLATMRVPSALAGLEDNLARCLGRLIAGLPCPEDGTPLVGGDTVGVAADTMCSCHKT